MRILTVSKFRQFTGGVEAHIDYLTELLQGLGHEVRSFASEDVPGEKFDAQSSGYIGRARTAGLAIFNRNALQALEQRLGEFRPDVVHLHSIYHQLTPSIFGALRGIPVVQTLHDYKLAAPCYVLERDGSVCTDCVGTVLAAPSVLHACVHGSRSASLVCAVEHATVRRRHFSGVDRFVVPSDFSRNVMISAGVDPSSLEVVRWGVPGVSSRVAESTSILENSRSVLFAGRLHPTKGISILLETWASMPLDVVLRIAGDGPLKEQVIEASRTSRNIEYLGLLDKAALHEEMRRCSVFVCPSVFPETLGLSAVEALTAGVPVISSGRGALADLDGPGVVTEPELSAEAWRNCILKSLTIASQLREDLAVRDLSMYRGEHMAGRMVRIYESAVAEYRRT